MLTMFIIMFIAGAFIYGAVRILAGWLLPAATVARLDRGVDAASSGLLKTLVVVIGLALLAAFVAAAVR